MQETLVARAPEIVAATTHELPASPRTFARFTGRPGGWVGGVPRRHGLGAYRELFPAPIEPGLWLVGDAVLLGQSTLATFIGGLRTAEALQHPAFTGEDVDRAPRKNDASVSSGSRRCGLIHPPARTRILDGLARARPPPFFTEAGRPPGRIERGPERRTARTVWRTPGSLGTVTPRRGLALHLLSSPPSRSIVKLSRPVVAALALLVGLPVLGLADAEAGLGSVMQASGSLVRAASEPLRVRVVTTELDGVAAVSAELASDAGDEDLTLVESNISLHGAATIAALPKADADLTVTLYDTGSAELATFSGTLGADGTVTLTGDGAKYDIELLAAEVFTAGKGYDVGVDLAGADTLAVAYATVTVTEGGAVCLATDEKGNCLKWDTSQEVSTRSELYWDAIGVVWEADATLAHDGLVELEVQTWDETGKKMGTTTSNLGMPWLDDGEGVNSLATDEDPLTTVAVISLKDKEHPSDYVSKLASAFSIVSRGWAAGDDIPAEAEVELTNGGTITIPVNSYQRVPRKLDFYSGPGFPGSQVPILLKPGSSVSITSGSVFFEDLSLADLSEPVCSGGLCVALVEDEENGIALSFGAYASAAEKLPEDAELDVVLRDADGAVVASDGLFITFDDEITAVFSNEVSFASDPIGLGLSGKVNLLGAPDGKGKQATLAKGTFYAELARDGDGDLALTGGDKNQVVSSGNAVVAGAAIGLDDGQGGLDAPPVIVYGIMGNGSGTKNASTQTSTRPQLL